jgi:hypothetical protein
LLTVRRQRVSRGRRSEAASQISVAEIIGGHALPGDRQKAVAALREAIDSGRRLDCWQLRSPASGAMREEPEWNALVEELEADIPRQREWYEQHRDERLF